MAGNKGLKSKELVKVPPNKIPRINLTNSSMYDQNHEFSFNWNMGIEHG